MGDWVWDQVNDYDWRQHEEAGPANEGPAHSPPASYRGQFVDGRVGNWLSSRSRKKIFVLDFREEDVLIEDVAHALSNQCRYQGHCCRFFSVAEHSLLVSRLVPKEFALAGLLHDASEAYLQDLARPVKHMPEFRVFRDVESDLERVISGRFGLPWPLPREVKDADNVALTIELLQLMDAANCHDWDGYLTLDPPRVELPCLRSGEAMVPFLDRFYELTGLAPPAGFLSTSRPFVDVAPCVRRHHAGGER